MIPSGARRFDGRGVVISCIIRGVTPFAAGSYPKDGPVIFKKTLLTALAIALLTAAAFGVATASPSKQVGAEPSTELLIAALVEADERGLLGDELRDSLTGWFIENIVADSGETEAQVRSRLSADGQDATGLLIAALRDADKRGLVSADVKTALTDWLIERIAERTGETPAETRRRLETPPPTPTPSPTATPSPTPTPVPPPTPTPSLAIPQVVANARPGVVQILTDVAGGSGFIIDSGGLVVTNAHVVERNPKAQVIVHGADAGYEGDVLGIDERADLALIQIIGDGDSFATIPLGDSSLVQLGEESIVMGYPLFSESVTVGAVSARFYEDGVEYLQTDTAVNPGNSGGPMLNAHGEVIGVVFAKIEQTASGRPVEGTGFAVAVNELKVRLDSLKAGESVYYQPPESRPEPPTGWGAYRNGEYGYTIFTAPGWTPDTESETADYVEFLTEDGMASLEVHSEELSAPTSLTEFAERRRDALRAAARAYAWRSFEVEPLERVEKSDDEYYLLRYRLQKTTGDCVSRHVERIRRSADYPDEKPYGFIISGGICENGLTDYALDVEAMTDSFMEWEAFVSAEYGYSMNIAPGWHPRALREGGEYASFLSWNRRGLAQIYALEVESSDTLDSFAERRKEVLDARADTWEEYEPLFIKSRREHLGGRDAYISVYRGRSRSGVCESGYVELVALSSYHPETPRGYLVITQVCMNQPRPEEEYRLNLDRMEMLRGFRY